MRMKICAFLAGVAIALPVQAACVAASGPGTAALVELYTSEGCSSCPPADRWLATLGPRAAAGSIVPLALHVDYWDYIGWKDPYAKREFSLRQRRLSQLQRMALVYTPQVMLQGRDFRQWGSRSFDDAVARINAQAARAQLRLQILGTGPAGLDVATRVTLAAPTMDADLFVAAYRSRLESRVGAGENRGRTLKHDYVVLEWQGPFPVTGMLEQRRRLALVPGAAAADSGVAAFVQDRRTGEVLQALLRSAC
jgi:hypothetical protein